MNKTFTIPDNMIYNFCILAAFVVVAVCVYNIWKITMSRIEEMRQASITHEEDMLELNRIKEERKRLLDFCYDMAQKKESETKESTNDKHVLTLDKIRQECWQIIKQMNGVNI